jgi:Flp pilus assembly protein TadD
MSLAPDTGVPQAELFDGRTEESGSFHQCRGRGADCAGICLGFDDSLGDRDMGALCAASWAHTLVTVRTVDVHRRGGVYSAHCSGLSLLSSRCLTGCRDLESGIGCAHGVDHSGFPQVREDINSIYSVPQLKVFGSVRSRSRDHEFKWCSKVRSLILAVLLTGFSLQVVACMGVQTSTATGSDDATPHFNRAVELHKKGDLAGAITEYRTALRLNPNEVEAHIHLGSALNVTGDPDGAITEYRTALRLNPNEVEAHHNLGLALHDKGDLAGAITEYRTVLRLNPNEVEAHYNLGLALNATGHLYGAITEYRTVLRLNPNEVEAHYNLGNALKALGRKADAREEFTEALRLLPDTPANQYKIKQVKQRIRELE